MPSKSFQTQNPGVCRCCGGQPLKTGASLLVSALSILGALFGMAGALLLAMPNAPGRGFGAFVVSSVAWLLVSARQRQWPQHAQQWVFLGCSLLGLWNWWLGPLVLG